MLMRSQQLKNLDVFSMRSGQPAAKIIRPIIDPYRLEIRGFYTTHQSEDILLARNIRELNRKHVIIDDADSFSHKEDLLRLEEILRLNYELLNKLVITQSKQRLGKVEDFVMDTLNYQIQKIHVHRPVWRSLQGGTLIIDRKQIIEVDDKSVTVSDTTVRAAAPAMQPIRN